MTLGNCRANTDRDLVKSIFCTALCDFGPQTELLAIRVWIALDAKYSEARRRAFRRQANNPIKRALAVGDFYVALEAAAQSSGLKLKQCIQSLTRNAYRVKRQDPVSTPSEPPRARAPENLLYERFAVGICQACGNLHGLAANAREVAFMLSLNRKVAAGSGAINQNTGHIVARQPRLQSNSHAQGAQSLQQAFIFNYGLWQCEEPAKGLKAGRPFGCDNELDFPVRCLAQFLDLAFTPDGYAIFGIQTERFDFERAVNEPSSHIDIPGFKLGRNEMTDTDLDMPCRGLEKFRK